LGSPGNGQEERDKKERTMNAAMSVKDLQTSTTSDTNRARYLRAVLVVVGLTFIFGIYPLSVVWPSGWAWGHGHSHYLMMILGVYATLGVFLLLASKNPAAHTSLIWFTVWSSVVHAVIMGVQALTDGAERGHLIGDVPVLLVVAAVLAALAPRGRRPL
jgi:FtsH-binding integral membrane protein